MSKILVIDDNVDILLALQELLKFYNYDVVVTERGEEAINLVNEVKPDLVILDLMLSGVDGREICAHLKSDATNKDIPVVMISAHPHASQTVKEAGADDFLPKPFDISSLLSTIQKNLSPGATVAKA